ncbi:MAG: long-chain fatty acid--CoA ligase [Candidatus Hecatellales archaeon]|nr:MAG: long-chain fatty acid--CoA ligase [Candidatus Hecatellales archaeon]
MTELGWRIRWLTLGEAIKIHAKNQPEKIALKDWRGKKYTYRELHLRTNKLANALLSLGLKKGDRISLFSYNCAEFIEILAACSKISVVVAPVSWRFAPPEAYYVIDNADTKAVFVFDKFLDLINSIRPKLKKVEKYVSIGETPSEGYVNYEEFLSEASDDWPSMEVDSKDAWIQPYTSGITGAPKGVVRSNESYATFYTIVPQMHGWNKDWYGAIIMPLFHVNSQYYGPLWLYIGASLYVGRDFRFDPVEFFELVDREKFNFTSLIPTHYYLMVNVPEETRRKYDLSSIKQLLVSSAPVLGEIKRKIMEIFPGVKLYEAYGTTEAGITLLLLPEDQLRKAGSCGREVTSVEVRLVDEQGRDVPPGEVGELICRSPMMFDEYWKLPERTEKAFSFGKNWFATGDLLRQDEEGYYYFVDRKDDMIMSGGEHVYPTEIEDCIARHPKVDIVSVVGLPDPKWGEAVTAVITPKAGETLTEEEIKQWCRGKISGYMIPKKIVFIKADEYPRTAVGKIIRRRLREKLKKELGIEFR